MQDPAHTGLQEIRTYMQPHYTPGELTIPSLEERQAGEDAIMTDMKTDLEPEDMEEATPSTEDMYMNLGMETISISAELGEQHLGEHQNIDGSAHGESISAAGDADWYEHLDDEELFKPESSTPIPSFLLNTSNDLDADLAEMLKDVDAWNKTHSSPIEPPEEDTSVETTPKEGFRHAVDPFTPEICKADLIRCPPTSPSATTDILDHFTKEYARSVRLFKLKQRWYHTSPSDWSKEVNVLIAAIDNKDNALSPWLPLFKWLALYHRLMQGATAHERFKTKNFLLKKMEGMARMRMEENKAAVVDLLEAKGMKLGQGGLCRVKQGVYEDCERRGSLLLGTIPEFTDEVVGGFSGRWSWVD